MGSVAPPEEKPLREGASASAPVEPFARVASFPPVIAQNPYQRLLYDALASCGVTLAADNRFKVGWLWKARREVDLLHFHWPQMYYRHDAGPPRLRPLLSWIRVGLFRARLEAARALGYSVVWTIHQVYPHELQSLRLERRAARILARASDVLIAHDEATATQASAELGRAAAHVELVPHGPYTGAYPAGRSREEMRDALGVASDAVLFLCFGHLRAYKSVDALLQAFDGAGLEDSVLVIAGMPLNDTVADSVRAAAAGMPRVRLLLEFIPDERVAELHAAADVVVLARSDGGTSGALVLALSLGLPVVAAAQPAYESLTAHGERGWHFTPGDVASLRGRLEDAARDPDARADKTAAARRAAGADWGTIAGRTAELFRKAVS